jgi:hypothetical protein
MMKLDLRLDHIGQDSCPTHHHPGGSVVTGRVNS